MAKDGAGVMVLASPFKFGFFAGLGFCFASLVMSALFFVFFALLGLGTIGSLLIGSSAGPRNWHTTSSETTTAAEPSDPAADATTAAAVVAPRSGSGSTYHRKPRTAGSE